MDKQDKLIELERPPITETAFLVRLVLPSDSPEDVDESLEEMRQLAWTAGADIAETIVQRRSRPCPATLIGSGKVTQLKEKIEAVEADMVIFDSDLSPAQGSKLEKLLDVKVVDRTQLILDIFAMRAHTNEGKLQVELAQLDYILPRLAGRGSIMRQQGGIGVRGPGEQKLEVDRRVIRRRIARLHEEIESIRRSRQVQRRRRTQEAVGTVALVGYTNAGKSSLLNALTGAEVFVENKLFATLDPRSRRCTLPSGREVVLSDTVGFIRKLPHALVAAFRATLEEVKEADLLLLVADASHPNVEDHIEAVRSVLAEIGAGEKDRILVFNKNDVAEPERVENLLSGDGARLAASARTGDGLPRLLETVDEALVAGFRRILLRIPQSEGRVLSRIYDSGRVVSQEYDGNEIVIDAELEPGLAGQLEAYRVRSE